MSSKENPSEAAPQDENPIYEEPNLSEPTSKTKSMATLVFSLIIPGVAILALGLVIGLPILISNSKPKHPDKDADSDVPHNVIVISIDTLRADVLGCYGGEAKTPNIDKLAGSGIIFSHCYTPNPLTLPAHASMLSGTSPIYHQVRDNTYQRVPKDNLVLLQEEFKAAGYATNGVISSAVLAKGCGLERGFDFYDDNIGAASAETTLRERNAEDSLAIASKRIIAEERNSFNFIHLFDPHFPYWPPDAKERGLPQSSGLNPSAIRPLYIAEVEYVDKQLGLFFDRLLSAGELENALIVITADHGEDLGDKGEITHGYGIYDGTTHVPLIVHGAINGAVEIQDAVSLTDVFIGVADYAKLRLSDKAKAQQQGISLKASVSEKQSSGRKVYLESHYGYLQNGWARLRGTHDGRTLTVIHEEMPEVYTPSFPADRNSYAQAGEAYLVSRTLVEERLNAWYATGRSTTLQQAREVGYTYGGDGHAHGGMSAKEAENLGYPVNAVGAPSFEKESLADSLGRPSPHERMEQIGRMQQTYVAFSAGRFASAIRMLDPYVNPTEGESKAGLQVLKLYARATMESANIYLIEKNYRSARRDAMASAKALRQGIDAAKSVKLDLAALEMEEAALLAELRLAKGEADFERVTALIVDFQARAAKEGEKIASSALRLRYMAEYSSVMARGSDHQGILDALGPAAKEAGFQDLADAFDKRISVISSFP